VTLTQWLLNLMAHCQARPDKTVASASRRRRELNSRRLETVADRKILKSGDVYSQCNSSYRFLVTFTANIFFHFSAEITIQINCRDIFFHLILELVDFSVTITVMFSVI